MKLVRKDLLVLLMMALVMLSMGAGTYWLLVARPAAVPAETRELFRQGEREGGGYTYVDENGNPKALDEYIGRVVVVTSWASWSPYSAVDLPTLNALAEEFSTEEVVFVALNRKEPLAHAQRFLQTIPPPSRVTIIVDTEDRFYTTVGGYAMPETVIYDQQGRIVSHIRGQARGEELRSQIQPLLEAGS